MDTLVFYDLKGGRDSYAEAARMYRLLRKKDVTVGSSVDCLIALTAMENGLFLLHQDSDYDRIREHYPLKVWDIS